MEGYLETTDAAFYHITTYSNWQKISASSLMPFNGKGISVLRTIESPIVHSVIALQLYSPAIEEENDFVIIKIAQSKCQFIVSEVVPDIVDEWTWPFQNNILRNNIEIEKLELFDRFSIKDWHTINMADYPNRLRYEKDGLMQPCFELIYANTKGIYKIDSNKEMQML